ncbi:AfsA-related hotdog domain-containing protein [Streptomyces uncialis]|uniref:A-factor biosynthesis hotdog domain-containing protein n=1 Tax=Streptomyces uncialis TaxID=1048205 RepID=A0A1Q4UZ39_9ACTN|nr:AfsA-related hotdog domain-containing protein [Streptomyces uncialis]MCX4663517.1 AfsA-related hotdog domain-containing protein [Streptomyces uncialis]OKH90793.1 hypothetical protein AB852_29900 [Streptomyces uncialis]WST70757.1 hypothetical protein OG268_26965 [Streptomyces uncialis]WTE10570.1 hypothetical protein OG924_09840 [Streptomyces uncialis]
MTPHAAPETSSAPAELSFGRTVDRSLVHRTAVSEVFVTDVQQLAARKVRTAVQLPLTHGYYSDHLQRPAVFDALLLLESGRQAAIAGSHVFMGLAPNTMMIVDRFRFSLDQPGGLTIGTKPGHIRIDTAYDGKINKRGRVRNGQVAQRYFVGDTEVATHEMDVLFLNPHENEVLRHSQRGTPAPMTSDFGDHGPGGDGSRQVPAHEVGRANPLNVVLSRAERFGERVGAEVTPRFDNRALFDHEYDHLPAMTLVEAARQLALLGSGEPLGTYAVGFEAGFSRFAELDDVVRAEAPRAVPLDGRGEVPVRFVQDGNEIAQVTVTVATKEAL